MTRGAVITARTSHFPEHRGHSTTSISKTWRIRSAQHRYRIEGTLYRKLRSTNAIENLNSGIATYSQNVKRWQGGSMVVRWPSSAIVEAEKKSRRVQGWRDIEKLVRALTLFEAKKEATAERVA